VSGTNSVGHGKGSGSSVAELEAVRVGRGSVCQTERWRRLNLTSRRRTCLRRCCRTSRGQLRVHFDAEASVYSLPLASSSISASEVTTLNHEAFDDTVEGGALVSEAVLASRESPTRDAMGQLNPYSYRKAGSAPEVLGGLGDGLAVESVRVQQSQGERRWRGGSVAALQREMQRVTSSLES